MKKKIFLLVLIYFIVISALFCQNPSISKNKIDFREKLLNVTSQGNDFWVAIPPNEYEGYNSGLVFEIYVASKKKTTVTLEYPGTNYKISKTVDSMKITTFSSNSNELLPAWEIYDSETPKNMGIHIYSDDSISVYVINSKDYTTDGYLAIPSSSWGKYYMHLSYYDYYDAQDDRARGGGFLILASENNTQCTIYLNGVGKGLSTTVEGRNIGDSIKVTLNKGQVYSVRSKSNANALGKFDFSGSQVTSTKPVGFISYHMRTTIPSFNAIDGRNHLSEMLPSVNTWGKKYYSTEFKRNNDGDFFRIIAAFDSTHWTMKSYDKITGSLIKSLSGTLTKSSDFYEYNQIAVSRGNSHADGIRGASVWEADKPVLVMQYSYSADWDSQDNFDPFMIHITPVEQYVNSTVFQVPSGKANFTYNFFNIIAIGDSSDDTNSKLKSLKFDNTYIYEINSELLNNRIPGTNLYWASITTTQTAHIVTGDTKFGGYIYGYDNHDAYGWPAAMSFENINEKDTMPPMVSINDNGCGEFTINITDDYNGSIKDLPRQVDRGIKSIVIVSSENMILSPAGANNLSSDTIYYEYSFNLIAKDKTEEGYAIYKITDNADNYILDTLNYNPENSALFTIKSQDNSSKSNIEPGHNISINVSISSSKWNKYQINNFHYKFAFKTNQLIFKGIEKSSNLDNTWKITLDSCSVYGDSTYLFISGNGTKPIQSNINLTIIYFFVLYDFTKQYSFGVSKFESNVNIIDTCISYYLEEAIIELNVCAPDIIRFNITATNYYLNISPNPSTSNNIDIKYGIGLDSYLNIDIYNSLGVLVKQLYNNDIKTGEYQNNINTNDFSSGVYYIKISSGPYLETKKIMIIK